MRIPRQTLLVIAAIFIVVLSISSFVILGIGSAYKKGLASFINQQEPENLTLFKKKTVKKIIIKKESEEGCMEVTPDGAVRVYSICGQTLTQADRPGDAKNILKLFKLVSEEDLSQYQQKTMYSLYQITVETDTGSQTYYFVADGGTGGQTIIDTIEQIVGDLPSPSPTPQQIIVTPTSLPFDPDQTPTPTSFFDVSPTPTPEAGTSSQAFSCGFSGPADQRPYNISNIVCSTQPTPIP